MKQTKHILATLAMLLCSLTASAEAVQIDGIWYNLVSKIKQAEVIRNPNVGTYDASYSASSITIPSTVTYNDVEYSVTKIGGSAFSWCESINKIVIPTSVTSIGGSAFYYCKRLTSINIPDSVTSIGSGAFYYCQNLTSINIPEGVTRIEAQTFESCTRLTSVIIPKSVTQIWKRAFALCTSLKDVTYSPTFTIEGVEDTYDPVFYGCYMSSFNMNVYIESIEQWLIFNNPFRSYCKNVRLYLDECLLKEVEIPSTITDIPNYAFNKCNELISINISEGVTKIGGYAFSDCSSLTSIILPESVTSIGNYTFKGCSSLTSITLPASVTSIGNYAFSGCRSLTSITLPESVTSIGEDAFYGCSSLTSITLPENVTSIGNYAFSGCHSLTSITIPEGVTSIGNYAFQSCSSLTSIVLPEKLKSVGSKAFANCTELLDVYCYAESVPSASSNAFDGSYPEYITLHVPSNALESYKTTAPWSSFGTIAPLKTVVTEITLSQSSATLPKGESLTLSATVSPDDAYDKTVTWSSSDENVAIVDAEGKVTAIALGTATITATANDGSGVTALCEVTVVKPTSVTLTVNQYASGTYCSEYALDFSEVDGLKAYAATGYDTETGVVTLSRVMTAKAGVGLFVKGTSGDHVVPVLENTSFNTLNMLVGTLDAVTLGRTSEDGLYVNYKYTLSGDNATPQFYVFDDGFTLGAGKAYLQVPAAWVQREARAISLRFDDGETTDIEEEIRNEKSEIIFDLMGRRVETPVKGGVYIVNGKKVVY